MSPAFIFHQNRQTEKKFWKISEQFRVIMKNVRKRRLRKQRLHGDNDFRNKLMVYFVRNKHALPVLPEKRLTGGK